MNRRARRFGGGKIEMTLWAQISQWEHQNYFSTPFDAFEDLKNNGKKLPLGCW